MAINGLSWPHTERIDLTQGDSAHWRVINLTEVDHPMHLHGFYFRVESKGDGVKDSVVTAAQQHLGVTEVVNPFETMSLSWLPIATGQLDLSLPLRRTPVPRRGARHRQGAPR